jgi:hypothetical protein
MFGSNRSRLDLSPQGIVRLLTHNVAGMTETGSDRYARRYRLAAVSGQSPRFFWRRGIDPE